MIKSVPREVKPLVFFKEVRSELERVTWPTKAETIRLTAIVVGLSIAVALYIATFDYIFTKAIGALLNNG